MQVEEIHAPRATPSLAGLRGDRPQTGVAVTSAAIRGLPGLSEGSCKSSVMRAVDHCAGSHGSIYPSDRLAVVG